MDTEPKMALAVVTAFKEEVKDYLKTGRFRVAAREGQIQLYRSSSQAGVVVAVGAVGRKRAEEATIHLIERFQPGLIVSAGFAAGVQPGLNAGDIVLCDRLLSIEGPAPLWDPDAARERSLTDLSVLGRLTDGIGGTPGRPLFAGCLSVPEFVPSSSTKAWIGEIFPVSIIDMESYWVSETAASYGISHAVVRCVLDPVEQTLPRFVSGVVGGPQWRRWDRTLRYLLTRPSEIPRLIHLARAAAVARASLSEFLTKLTSALASPLSAAID